MIWLYPERDIPSYANIKSGLTRRENFRITTHLCMQTAAILLTHRAEFCVRNCRQKEMRKQNIQLWSRNISVVIQIKHEDNKCIPTCFHDPKFSGSMEYAFTRPKSAIFVFVAALIWKIMLKGILNFNVARS